MKFFHYKYLSQEQLKRLDTYKYAAIDTSPLSKYVMHPFWNYVVEFVPMNIAPNVLTLAGFSCTLLNALLLSYYDYHFYASSDDMRSITKPVPSIIWLICAINLFLAHTLDGIDGKQARRTKATGPLGELMDHGVDSWTAVFVPMHVYSLFGASDFSFGPHRMMFIFWAVFLTFYVSHWEKYNTGVLYLPWSYDVSQIFLLGCTLATFFGSYKLWKATFPFIGLPYSHAFEIVLYVSILFTLPLPIYNVYKTCKSGRSKYSTFGDVIRPLASFSLLFVISTMWALCSRNDVLDKDSRMYFYTIGTIFSNISCRLIICQMSGTRCEIFNGFCILFSLVALAAVTTPFVASTELLALRFLALILTLAHLHYAVSVVQQMCDHFKIEALSLTRNENDSSRQRLLVDGMNTSSLGLHRPNDTQDKISRTSDQSS
jgi:ethanolaminephosphotransferase